MIRARAATALLFAALAGCGPSSTTPRRLWLNVPRDGIVVLQDTEPPPF